jgi:alpha-tubulin suppressor-like RCC1 family protein
MDASTWTNSQETPTHIDFASTTLEEVGAPTAVACGEEFSCAVMRDKTVQCWGSTQHGVVPQGSGRARAVQLHAVTITGLTSVLEVAAGATHACALQEDGTVLCWGSNEHGELGDGTRISRPKPRRSTIIKATHVVAGTGYTCILSATRNVMCWGRNDSGQLGDGTTTDRDQQARVSAIDEVHFLTTGQSHSCAIDARNRVVCWGSNAHGELGDGTKVASPIPVDVRALRSLE